MTESERLDEVQARGIANSMLLALLMSEAPATTRAKLDAMAKSAKDHGLFQSLTDRQIEQIQEMLLSLR
jgi:hypothetical protein